MKNNLNLTKPLAADITTGLVLPTKQQEEKASVLSCGKSLEERDSKKPSKIQSKWWIKNSGGKEQKCTSHSAMLITFTLLQDMDTIALYKCTTILY